MGGTTRILVAVGVMVALASGSSPVSSQSIVGPPPPHYTMLDLGGFGGSGSGAFRITNGGIIVGDSLLPGNGYTHAFRSSGVINPATDDLGVPQNYPANSNSVAADINGSGQIAALALAAGATGGILPYHSFLIPSGATMADAVDLQTLGGDFTFAEGMNDSGQIVGWSGLPGGGWHAFRYSSIGIVDIGTFSGSLSHAYDINNNGVVVGWIAAPGGTEHAFRTLPNTPIRAQDDLGTLGGTTSIAKLINDSGVVAGMSDALDGTSHVFRTKPNAGLDPTTDDVGTLPGSLWAEPFGMNAAGDLVGWSYISSLANTRAFVSFGSANAMYNLNDLIDTTIRGNWVFDNALGINDLGQIVASALRPGDSYDHSFLLTPVPEPGALGMLGLSLILLGRRRRAVARGPLAT